MVGRHATNRCTRLRTPYARAAETHCAVAVVGLRCRGSSLRSRCGYDLRRDTDTGRGAVGAWSAGAQAPADSASMSTTPTRRPCRRVVCAGTGRKNCSGNGCTAATAVCKNIGTCFRPTSDCTSGPRATVLIGWTCRQLTLAGCTVRTSTGRRSPAAMLHRSSEATHIRPRGGPWRASTPGAKPKPRCDRAARREPPLPTSPRR